MKYRRISEKIIKNLILILVFLFCVFPLLWVVIAATNASVDILRGTLLPGTYLRENWKKLVETYEVWPALWNSVKYSTVTTIVSLVVSSIAGYGFEVYHDRWKDRLFSVLMLTMLVSNMMSGHYIDYGMLMLAVLISTLPTVIIFFALQKGFVEGMTGAVKG